ncbi:MAG: type II toxin-antitoxin system VapC family toxin [Bacteriovorax sp.]|jgi:predicted nucleic acid-binding protein|nr:type II toxin-antitoxin system VapC family toxin [Bacteriovorax sp.]
MNRFVLDCSVAMSWCFEDEKSPEGDSVLDHLMKEESQGVVPSLWRLEVVNVLNVAERRGRLPTAKSLLFLDFLLELPIVIDENPQDLKDILLLSRTYGLSAYDAAYLDLASREQIPLATLDNKLKSAANAASIPLFSL